MPLSPFKNIKVKVLIRMALSGINRIQNSEFAGRLN